MTRGPSHWGALALAVLSVAACTATKIDNRKGNDSGQGGGGDHAGGPNTPNTDGGDGASIGLGDSGAGGFAGCDCDGGAAGAFAAGEGGSSGDGSASTTTMFLSNGITGVVSRYALAPDVDPLENGTISLPSGGVLAELTAEGMAMSSAGELFVADDSAGTIYRFLSPLTTPVANGILTVPGFEHIAEIAFVDDELWVPNITTYCTTTPKSLVRVAFDARGNASAAGTVTGGFVGADRGVLWVPATRDLYESQCAGVDTIQHYRVAADHTVTALTPITGNGLNSPIGMVFTAWGELLILNSNSNDILRYRVDAQGNATANGTITGNGLSIPVGAAFTPWGELVVVNNGNATLSRFTFDSTHAAINGGSYQLSGPTVAMQGGFGPILIVSNEAGAHP